MNELDYWDAYYRRLPPNTTPLHPSRQWQWDKILTHIPDFFEGIVLDVGCGDLPFWKGIVHHRYRGLDISPTIQQRNRELRPTWTFHQEDITEPNPDRYRADTVLCLNVIYHIMTYTGYDGLMENLNAWTSKNLVIYTWHKPPIYSYDKSYQRHHTLSPEDLPDHQLVASYQQYTHVTLYIYQRKETPP